MTVRAAAGACLAALSLGAGPIRAQQPQVLAGRVASAGSGAAIAGAEIRAVCHPMATVTAADGTWRLGPLPALFSA